MTESFKCLESLTANQLTQVSIQSGVELLEGHETRIKIGIYRRQI